MFQVSTHVLCFGHVSTHLIRQNGIAAIQVLEWSNRWYKFQKCMIFVFHSEKESGSMPKVRYSRMFVIKGFLVASLDCTNSADSYYILATCVHIIFFGSWPFERMLQFYMIHAINLVFHCTLVINLLTWPFRSCQKERFS